MPISHLTRLRTRILHFFGLQRTLMTLLFFRFSSNSLLWVNSRVSGSSKFLDCTRDTRSQISGAFVSPPERVRNPAFFSFALLVSLFLFSCERLAREKPVSSLSSVSYFLFPLQGSTNLRFFFSWSSRCPPPVTQLSPLCWALCLTPSLPVGCLPPHFSPYVFTSFFCYLHTLSFNTFLPPPIALWTQSAKRARSSIRRSSW